MSENCKNPDLCLEENQELMCPICPNAANGCSASTCSANLILENQQLKNKLVEIAAKIAKRATMPEYTDAVEWFKTTPQKERDRMCMIFRTKNNSDKILATEIMAYLRNLKS